VDDAAGTLVCFAVKEEAAFFKPGRAGLEMLLTGMGRRNADRVFRAAIQRARPRLVLSCGFAGGLNPELPSGEVVFSTDDPALASRLQAAGARQIRFHCAERVVVAAQEKLRLRETTRADAVEMESQVISEVCREHGIRSATVRVILDPAGEDLPLDFNALMTADQQMDYAKLAGTLLKAPSKIGSLLKMQKQCRTAAERLARVVLGFIGSGSSAQRL
jgi:adenosylhomocysteine nucleosidase